MKKLRYFVAFMALLLVITAIVPSTLFSEWVTPTGDGEEGMNNFEFKILLLRLGASALATVAVASVYGYLRRRPEKL